LSKQKSFWLYILKVYSAVAEWHGGFFDKAFCERMHNHADTIGPNGMFMWQIFVLSPSTTLTVYHWSI